MKFDNLTTFSADNLSAEGTKWSSATQTLVGSHNLSTAIPCFFSLSKTLSTPGPDTSCIITLSTSAKTTSSGATEDLPEARARIFSTIFIIQKVRSWD